jgi:phosphonate transport system substrate-binding protein
MHSQEPAFMHRRNWVIAASLLGLAPFVRAQNRGLVFGVISPRSPEQTRENWWPFVERLGRAIGQPIALNVYESAGQMVGAFKAAEVDLGWMGNAPALDVVEANAGSVFAQMVTRDGNHGYKSQIVVGQHLDSVRNLGDVLASAKRLTFSDGDPKSTSGYLVPLYFAFQKNGVADVPALFKRYEFGSHQENLKKVATGGIDVATANNEELAFFSKDFPDLGKKIKVVWESPLIHQSPLLWRTGLPPALREKINRFVIGFGQGGPEEKAILDKVNGLSRFRPSSNLQLVPIADLEMFKARQAINNDASLTPQERARRIDEVIKRGSSLELRLKLVFE